MSWGLGKWTAVFKVSKHGKRIPEAVLRYKRHGQRANSVKGGRRGKKAELWWGE